MTQVNPVANPPVSSAGRPHLPALTGLRALLALSIVGFHFSPPHTRLLDPLFDNGFVFVGFFFLLSGFVLTYNYSDRAAPMDKRRFWQARLARLYPVYLLSLAISLPVLVGEWHQHSHLVFSLGVVLTLLLAQGWLPMLATFWNLVAWTLSAEALFYAVFPWTLGRNWPRSTVRLIGLTGSLWVLGLLPSLLYLWLNPDHLSGTITRYSSGYWLHALKYTPMPYICTFLIGVALGKLHLAMPLSVMQRTAVALASLLALAAFFASGVAGFTYVLIHGDLLVPLFAALIVGLSGENPVARLFSARPLVYLGEASYCLFLLHFNLIYILRLSGAWAVLHLQPYEPWISYSAAILLALAAYHLVEEPARRAILRRPA